MYNKWAQRQMVTWLFGAIKWALGKNGHHEKRVQLYGQLVIAANGYFGHLIGQTRTFEADGHRDK